MTSNDEEKKAVESLTDDEKRQLRSVCEALDIKSLDALHLAQELTLMDHGVFAEVDGEEYHLYAKLNSEGSLKSFDVLLQCPGILAVGRRYNACFMWVQYEVLRHAAASSSTSASAAARGMVEKFIDVAWECRELSNFQAVNFIMKAIHGYAVKAVFDVTEATLSVSHRVRFDVLAKLASSRGGSRSYRMELSASTPPAVPVHGMFLKELMNLPQTRSTHTWRTKDEEIEWCCFFKQASTTAAVASAVDETVGGVVGSDISELIASFCGYSCPYDEVLCSDRLESHRNAVEYLRSTRGDVDDVKGAPPFSTRSLSAEESDSSHFRNFGFDHRWSLHAKLSAAHAAFERHRWNVLEEFLSNLSRGSLLRESD